MSFCDEYLLVIIYSAVDVLYVGDMLRGDVDFCFVDKEFVVKNWHKISNRYNSFDLNF